MPVRIPSDQHETVVSVLREAARVNGDVEAYVEPDVGDGRRRLTFAEWDRAADGVAGHLARLGVARGDVVCLLLPSSIDYAVLYGGLLRLGAITSGINPRMGAGEVASILDRAAPVLVVVDPEREAGSTRGRPRWSPARRRVPGGTERGPDRLPQLASSDPVAVVWTSGTTGRPKGALFDHANLAAVARGTDVLSHPGDRRLSPVPFAHVGYMTRAWDEIGNAVTTVITPTPWRADEAIRVMADEGVTVAQGVPTQWVLMLASDALPPADLSALRVAATGAARTTADLVAEVRRRFGVPVVVRYTSTESSLGTGTTLTSTDEEVATTVGRPVAGVELAIVDDEGESGARRHGRPRAPAFGRGHARLLGPRPGPRSPRWRTWWTRRPPRRCSARTGGSRPVTSGGSPPKATCSCRAAPTSATSGAATTCTRPRSRRPCRRTPPWPGRPWSACPTTSWARSAWPWWSPWRARRPTWPRCVRTVPGSSPTTRRPTRLVLVDELPLTPMMKVDPVRLAALAARGAEERRQALERSRRPDAGVLGNGPTGEEDEKERA